MWLLFFLIGRKRQNPKRELSESQISWRARFADLIEDADRWWESSSVERWVSEANDGTRLVADYIPHEDSHRYAICVHGYEGERSEMRKYGAAFASWGLNVLLPDNRAHGESGGRWIGMGVLESKDLKKWVGEIVKRDPSAAIFLFGVSLGGSTVMMASGLDLPDNVRFCVEDCGYTSPWEEFSYKLKSYHVPPYPLLHLTSWFSKVFAGYSFREYSAPEALSRNSRPFIFIHGKTDTFVPYRMLKENVDAMTKGRKTVLEIEGAGHALSVTKGRKEYFAAIKAYVDEFLV